MRDSFLLHLTVDPALKTHQVFFSRVSSTRGSVFKIPGPLTHRPRGQRRRSICQKTRIRSRNTASKRCCLKPTTQGDLKAATTATWTSTPGKTRHLDKFESRILMFARSDCLLTRQQLLQQGHDCWICSCDDRDGLSRDDRRNSSCIRIPSTPPQTPLSYVKLHLCTSMGTLYRMFRRMLQVRGDSFFFLSVFGRTPIQRLDTSHRSDRHS